MADSYEDLEPYFPEDDFADKYADELEMLREWDDPDVPPRRGRQLFPPPPPPPHSEGTACSDPELQDASLSVKGAHPAEDASEGVGEEMGQTGDPPQCHSPGGRGYSPPPLHIDDDTMEINRTVDISSRLTRDTGDECSPRAAALSESMLEDGYSEHVSTGWTTGGDLGQLETHEQNAVTVDRSHPLLFRGRVYKRIPPGPHITVTRSDGARVYLKMRPGGGDSGKPAQPKRKSTRQQLLGVPFSQLRRQVEEERRRRMLESVKSLQTRSSQELHSLALADSEPLCTEGSTEVGSEEEGVGQEQVLWVDKYAPSHFTELLSDDGNNRTLLAWLKLWDEVVFGRSAVLNKGPAGYNSKNPTNQLKLKNGKKPFLKRFEYQDPKTFNNRDALDSTGRPMLKVSLLCGPPGLGKTTLAHIIAKQAGYNVVEMNASDDRSPNVFAQRISSATQMQAAVNAAARPNCLIIDEIDGAPAASINVLLEILKRKDTAAGQKKRKELLSRPIICICNDQYVPALRELRQFAMLLVFTATDQSRLVQRLLEVCRTESMTASLSALTTLCDKAENDIRSCLNTLQFLRRRRKEIDLLAVQNASVGQKDAQKSLFSLWKDIFQLPTAKRQAISFDHSTQPQGAHPPAVKIDRFSSILSAVLSVGEHEKVAQGIFENYPNTKYRDPSMRVTARVLEWMLFQDVVQQTIMSTQNYSLYRCLPFAAVAAHMYLATTGNPRIHYPHQQFEVLQATQHANNVLHSLLTDVPPSTKIFTSQRLLSAEMLPLLAETLAPTLRPVNVQLYTAKEKQLLSDVVNTMVSFNLTYHQDRNSEGQYAYQLEPNIDLLVRFPGLPQRRQLTYAAKQLIGREIEVEKMRRAERLLHKGQQGVDTRTPVSAAAPTTSKMTAAASTSVSEGPSAAVNAQDTPARSRKRKATRDFFTRLSGTQKKKKGDDVDKTSSCRGQHVLWFRYNQGFLSAVRRSVKIQDLL